MKNSLYILLIIIFFCNRVHAQKQLTRNKVDPFSTTSCYVLQMYKDSVIRNATGFFIKIKSSFYFITNDHVVGGEFYINEYKRDSGRLPPINALPTSLTVRTYGEYFPDWKLLSIPIKSGYSGEYEIIHFWDDETKQVGLLDVVAIKIPESKARAFNINESNTLTEENKASDITLFPSLELFVVGFPFEFGSQNLYPIWKRATIASEPSNSSFYIDATTRPGMSGSPVFFRGFTMMRDNSIAFTNQNVTTLIGIYAAQNTKSEFGVVIKMDAILKKLSKESN